MATIARPRVVEAWTPDASPEITETAKAVRPNTAAMVVVVLNNVVGSLSPLTEPGEKARAGFYRPHMRTL